jgi:NYN domain
MTYSSLTLQQKETVILTELAKNPNITSKEIAKKYGFGKTTVERNQAWINRVKPKIEPLKDSFISKATETRRILNSNKKPNSKIKVFVDSANIISSYHLQPNQTAKSQSEKLIECLKHLINSNTEIEVNYYVFVNHTLSKVYNQLTELGVIIHFTQTNIRNTQYNNLNNYWEVSYEGNCDELIIADMPLLASRSEEIILFSNDSDYLRVLKNILEYTECKITIVNTINTLVWDSIKNNSRVKIITLDQLLLEESEN